MTPSAIVEALLEGKPIKATASDNEWSNAKKQADILAKAAATYGVAPMPIDRIKNLVNEFPPNVNGDNYAVAIDAVFAQYYGQSSIAPYRQDENGACNDATGILVQATIQGYDVKAILKQVIALAPEYDPLETTWLIRGFANPKTKPLFDEQVIKNFAAETLAFFMQRIADDDCAKEFKVDLRQVATAVQAAGFHDLITPEITAELL